MIRLIFLLCVFLVSCTEHRVIKTYGPPVNKAQNEIPKNQLLDVGIRIFDFGRIEDDKPLIDEHVVAEVRKAEAYYMAVELRNTIEESGQWGLFAPFHPKWWISISRFQAKSSFQMAHRWF